MKEDQIGVMLSVFLIIKKLPLVLVSIIHKNKTPKQTACDYWGYKVANLTPAMIISNSLTLFFSLKNEFEHGLGL